MATGISVPDVERIIFSRGGNIVRTVALLSIGRTGDLMAHYQKRRSIIKFSVFKMDNGEWAWGVDWSDGTGTGGHETKMLSALGKVLTIIERR